MSNFLRTMLQFLFLVTLLPLHACEAEVTVETVDVQMSDGVALKTDVHRPEGEGPWPTLLMRSTYGRKHDVSGTVKDGYAVVIQDVRGMGESPGESHVFYADGWREGLKDGRDTVAWIKAQPWCNGRIGTMGGSALGITQMLLAPTTDSVQAQVIEVAPISTYHAGVYQGGVLNQSTVEAWLRMIGQPNIIDVFKGHPYLDSYWTQMDTRARTNDITAPALFVSGWYDMFQQSSIDAFVARETAGGEGARGKNYLIMKWSPHGPDTTPDYVLNGNRFKLPAPDLRDRFLRANLQGDASALDGMPKVQYYVFGDDAPGSPGNEWRTADQWPPVVANPRAYFLTANNELSAAAGDAGALSFTYDPKNPFPTLGGNNLTIVSGPYDQRPHTSTRKDFVKFETEALAAPLEVIGNVQATLYVSSDAPDTDFTVKLVDVFPDGREILVLDNIQRVKLRRDLSYPMPLLRGSEEIVRVDIDLWSTAWIFNTGHKIALHVSSSNAPRFEPNPNTGADHSTPDGETRVANNTIHVGAATPSLITLPVVAK